MSSFSVAKHSYISAGPQAKAKAKAHVNYIQHRSGHDKEQGTRQFFDKDGDAVTSASVKKDIDGAGDRGVLIHKLILSPGVQGVDLKQYTRELMEEIGDRKGLDLEWKAVIHKNTDHDHVHVVVMGKDRDGRTVRFNRNDYQSLREIGDRYLERKHEFDRYFDRTMDNLLKEGGNRSLDLDKLLFRPFELEFEEPKKGKSKGNRAPKDRELHEKQEYTRLPARRKPRRQRILEARGRKDRDYFHDLYQRQTSRKDLENRIAAADPEKSQYYKEQLAFLNQIDADRRADALARSAELDRILGITPDRKPTKDSNQAAESFEEKSDLERDAEPEGPAIEQEPEREIEDRAAAIEMAEELAERLPLVEEIPREEDNELTQPSEPDKEDETDQTDKQQRDRGEKEEKKDKDDRDRDDDERDSR